MEQTFKVTDPETGRVAKITSPDGVPPTENELNQIFATQQGSSNESSRFLSNKPIEDSPTNLIQDITLSFIPTEEGRLKYLQEEFEGSQLELDEQGEISVDGRRVNPRGFDLGDISRNVGNVFPFAGQVAGSALGFAGGATLSSPTIAGVPLAAGAGAVGGGTIGATLGKGLQLATGKMLGLDIDGDDIYKALAEEAQLASTSEALGLGAGALIGKLSTKFGKSKTAKGLADLWEKSVKKLEKSKEGVAPRVVEFVAGVDRNATEIAQKFGFKNVLNEKHFDPERTIKIVNRILYGKEKVNSVTAGLKGTDIKNGTTWIAKSIKEIDDSSFDDVIKYFSDGKIDDNAISAIKEFGVEKIVNSELTSPDASFKIANKLLNSINEHTQNLGKQIQKQELKAIRNSGKKAFDLSDIVQEIRISLDDLELTKGIKVPGFQVSLPPEVRGQSELKKLVDLFKEYPTKESVKRLGLDPNKKIFFNKISYSQAARRKKQFDVLADEIFLNQKIPGAIKNSVRKIAQKFRNQYYSALGLEDQTKAFRLFRDVTDTIKIDKRTTLKQFENTVKNFSKRDLTTRLGVDDILEQLPNGNKIRNAIRISNTADSLAKIDPVKISKNIESKLNNKNILKENFTSVEEGLLKELDQSLRLSKKTTAMQRKFFDEAQQNIAAKQFLEGTPNLLRVGALANIAGLGSIGFSAGGGVGAIFGGLTALTISDPKTMAKILVASEKFKGKALNAKIKSIIRETKDKIPKFNNVINASERAVLGRLLEKKKSEFMRK